MRGELIRDAARLAALEPAWWRLWRRAPEATPFQSPAWLLPWWHAFAPGELAVAAAWDGDGLAGLAPFYLDGARLLPVGISLSDHLDVLLDPAQDGAAEILAKLLAALPWREWEMGELRPSAAAWRLPLPDGCDEAVDWPTACAVLPLPGEVPKRQRRKARMALNRAERRGGPAFRRGGAEAVADLLRLHALRWGTRGQPGGVLADPRVAVFLLSAAPGLEAAGLLRLRRVEIGGATAGAWMGLHHAGRAYAYLGGFDPAFARESPGTLLMAHAIAEAEREGATELDMLRGDEAYKLAWGCRRRANGRRVFARENCPLPQAGEGGDPPQVGRVRAALEGRNAALTPALSRKREREEGTDALPANIALMRLIAAARDRAELEAMLDAAPDPRLRGLWDENPQSWPLLRGILAEAPAGGALLFERAVAVSPEAAVALYSLGRADLLAAATAEIVALLEGRGLVAPGRRVLEIGCGIGRLMAPLAERGALVLGLDVSAGMLAEAARRCRAPTALAVRGGGGDLACVADGSVDLVLAVDSFPYLVEAGVAAAHVAEARRVLRPGGTLLVLNWSYRGDAAADRAEAAALAAAHGFALAECGPGPFRHWDGRLYRLHAQEH